MKQHLDIPAEIAIFKTISQLLTEEQKAENVLNELENIDQDGRFSSACNSHGSLICVTGDNLITKEEIVAFCEKNPEALNVLGVASVEDLMGKFDEDGSGQLDEEELKQLRAFIQQKRKENQERIRKLQESVGQSALRPNSAMPRVCSLVFLHFNLLMRTVCVMLMYHQAQTGRASFSESSEHQILHIEDVKSDDGSQTSRSRGGGHQASSRPASSAGRTAGAGAGVESTHAVFKNVESQVHQLGVSLESITSHIAALAQLASLAANSGSHSFGGYTSGGNGSATPRLGGIRARPEVIDTRAGENCGSGWPNVHENLSMLHASHAPLFIFSSQMPTSPPTATVFLRLQQPAVADLSKPLRRLCLQCLPAWPSNVPPTMCYLLPHSAAPVNLSSFDALAADTIRRNPRQMSHEREARATQGQNLQALVGVVQATALVAKTGCRVDGLAIAHSWLKHFIKFFLVAYVVLHDESRHHSSRRTNSASNKSISTLDFGIGEAHDDCVQASLYSMKNAATNSECHGSLEAR
jgi:hypothetical protein